jgi:cytochrome oxidase assembly protein ShyY1
MDWQAAGVISNSILVFALICITAYYAWQVKKQTDQMEKNRRIERLHMSSVKPTIPQ